MKERFFPRDATTRYPVLLKKPDFNDSSTKNLNITLNCLRMDTNRLTLNMMNVEADSEYREYDKFACNRERHVGPQPGPEKGNQALYIWKKASGSLEGLHNVYHGFIGGFPIHGEKTGGHMTEVPVAAFDPIFWMHHCQIDRLFAIWQAIHDKEPKSWFSDEEMANSPLLPFRNAAGKNYWNSNRSQKTEDFGYTYPEIRSTKEATWETFNNMYVWSIELLQAQNSAIPPPDMRPYDVRTSQFFNFDGKATSSSLLSQELPTLKDPVLQGRVEALQKAVPMDPSAKGYSREWFIDDRVQR